MCTTLVLPEQSTAWSSQLKPPYYYACPHFRPQQSASSFTSSHRVSFTVDLNTEIDPLVQFEVAQPSRIQHSRGRQQVLRLLQTSENLMAKWCGNPRSHKSCGMLLYVLVTSLICPMLQLVDHRLSSFASPYVRAPYHKVGKKHFNYMHCWLKLNGQSK